MIGYSKRITLCLMLGLLWLLPAQAQEADNEGIARVAKITPKEGHEKALVDAITEYHHWVAQFEGHLEYSWYEIVTGPDTGSYIARTPRHNWADFDAEYDWQKEAGERFRNSVAPHIQDADVSFTREMKDFSHWPESFEGYTHFQVQEWYVKGGQYGKFRAGLKRIVDTLKAGGFPGYWGFFSVDSGGYGGQIQLVSANKGWADMTDEDPSFFDLMSKELGGQEALQEFMSDWGSTYKSGANRMVVSMPKASDYGED